MEIIALTTAVLIISVTLNLWLAAKVHQLQPLAVRDSLTGLYHHGEIEKLMDKAVRRAYAAGWPVSLVILDIDHFKQFNDNHGYRVGDAVLRRVADTLREFLELGDLVGRWGGEEFVVVLPGVSSDNARRIAERLRSWVATLSPSYGIGITISLGVACRSANNPDEIFQAANDALRRAKAAGRNRVEVG